MGKEKVNLNRHIIGCGRWVRGGGACAMAAGHGGACVAVTGPSTKGGKR